MVTLSESTAAPFKVVHIINDLAIGGAEMMLLKLLSTVNSNLFTSEVISLGSRAKLDSRIEKLGIPVHNMRMSHGRIPRPAEMVRLIRTVRSIDPDLIHGWMYHGSLAAQFCEPFISRRVRMVWGIHNCNNDLKLEKALTANVIRLCGRLSKRPAQIIYVSETSRRHHEWLGYHKDNAAIIPNGFDTSHFSPSEGAREAVCRELRINGDSLLIGLVGRFHPMKDHLNFVRAAELLAKTNSNAHFLMAGRGVDSANPVLRPMLSGAGLSERTHLLGERDDIPRLLAALDICSLSSSHGESFPNVVGEAMSAGVPCVATDLGDIAKLVGPTGRVVPPRDPQALADAWQELIGLGETERKLMGNAARRRIANHFSIGAVIAQYEALFASILAPAGANHGQPDETGLVSVGV